MPPINQPKIRGFLAAQNAVAVLLYRKSSRITYVIRWDYHNQKDILTPGSRFYGRLYPNRCDLSPNGELLVYFAMGNKGNCWTAVCAPPSLTALYSLDYADTWTGGGRFITNEQVFILPPVLFNPTKKEARYKQPSNQVNENCKVTFDFGLLKTDYYSSKGWTPTQKHDSGHYIVWQKTHEELVLVMQSKNEITRDGEYSSFEYTILAGNQRVSTHLQPIHWADFDLNKRLIIASGGEIIIYLNVSAVLEGKFTRLDIAGLITQYDAERKKNPDV